MNGGGGHNVMLKPDGTVWAWGWNDSGQVGNGTTTDTYVPYHVRYIAAMNGGGEHNVMLKPDGTVWAWGWNDSGQVGNGTTTDTYVPYHVPLPRSKPWPQASITLLP